MAQLNNLTIDDNFYEILNNCEFKQYTAQHNTFGYDIIHNGEKIQLLIKINNCRLITYVKDKNLSVRHFVKRSDGNYDRYTAVTEVLAKIKDLIVKKLKCKIESKLGASKLGDFVCTTNDFNNNKLKVMLDDKLLINGCYLITFDHCTIKINLKSALFDNVQKYYLKYYTLELGNSTSILKDYNMDIGGFEDKLEKKPSIHFYTSVIKHTKKRVKKIDDNIEI
jgi:hypothetical protein